MNSLRKALERYQREVRGELPSSCEDEVKLMKDFDAVLVKLEKEQLATEKQAKSWEENKESK